MHVRSRLFSKEKRIILVSIQLDRSHYEREREIMIIVILVLRQRYEKKGEKRRTVFNISTYEYLIRIIPNSNYQYSATLISVYPRKSFNCVLEI